MNVYVHILTLTGPGKHDFWAKICSRAKIDRGGSRSPPRSWQGLSDVSLIRVKYYLLAFRHITQVSFVSIITMASVWFLGSIWFCAISMVTPWQIHAFVTICPSPSIVASDTLMQKYMYTKGTVQVLILWDQKIRLNVYNLFCGLISGYQQMISH